MGIPFYKSESLDKLRHQYYNDKLFRTLFPVLSQLEVDRDELSPVLIWRETEILRERLKATEFPETEVYAFPAFLIEDLQIVLGADGEPFTRRMSSHAERSMLCVLMVLLFQLADAGESADAQMENPNHATCVALAKILANPKYNDYVSFLYSSFVATREDAYGKRIVLPQMDYMKDEANEQALDEHAKADLEKLLTDIMAVTANLKSLFTIDTDTQKTIWRKILVDKELLLLMSKKSPRGFSKSINLKLICNILGIMQHISAKDGKTLLDTDTTKVNNYLGDKNYRQYIYNHNVYSDSYSCVITQSQHEKIEKIISSIITS